MNMKKRYKKACDLWFSKEVSKEVVNACESLYGFDDEDLDDDEIQGNVLCLFRDMYFEEEDENYQPKYLVMSN
jgi:hypothetical protein